MKFWYSNFVVLRPAKNGLNADSTLSLSRVVTILTDVAFYLILPLSGKYLGSGDLTYLKYKGALMVVVSGRLMRDCFKNS